MDKDGYIELIEYAHVRKEGVIIDMIPAFRCRYRIGASMTHSTGHYVCEERLDSGDILQHNDGSVSKMKSNPNMGREGYFLRLERVDKKPV